MGKVRRDSTENTGGNNRHDVCWEFQLNFMCLKHSASCKVGGDEIDELT